jgi:two-component system KDP operon response regulator KdpE
MDEMDRTKVLVVDDEPQIAWVLKFSLEAEGYQTITAEDGARALLEVAERRPEVMLLDLMMPTLNGWRVLEELQNVASCDRPRVIVVSALSDLGDRSKAIEMGADAFVVKPFDVDEVLNTLQTLGFGPKRPVSA